MDFSTGNWRVREAVAEDVQDILQMIKVLNRKLKIPQNLNYAIIMHLSIETPTPPHPGPMWGNVGDFYGIWRHG